MAIRSRFPSIRPIVLAVAACLAAAGVALAQTAPTPAQAELDAARAALDQAAARYAELAGGRGQAIRIERTALRKPVLGVLLAADPQAGVRIAGVTPGSAAEAVGLASGDRIVAVEGTRIDASNGDARLAQARELLASLDANTPVRLAYERDGKPRSVAITPKLADRLLVVPGDAPRAGPGEVRVVELRGGGADWAAVAPDIRREVIRLRGDCEGNDCTLPALAEALRWNGLNLAALDAQLGRYFGTSEGVLVLSTGPELAGLQAGDVIRAIGGKPVRTPREAMAALRAQPADGRVAIEYLRDRARGTAQVSVPRALPFRIPAPPPPPAPPAPPAAPGGPPAPPALTAPRASAAGHTVEKRRYVMVDKDGQTRTWEGGPGDTPPDWVRDLPRPPAPPAPPAPPSPPGN